MLRFLAHLRSAARQALADDVFNTAKAAAYSGMLMLFPALLVATTLLEGMQRIARAFVEKPETILQELVKAAVELCGAERRNQRREA